MCLGGEGMTRFHHRAREQKSKPSNFELENAWKLCPPRVSLIAGCGLQLGSYDPAPILAAVCHALPLALRTYLCFSIGKQSVVVLWVGRGRRRMWSGYRVMLTGWEG